MPQIEPRTLKGFRDFLPEQQIARQRYVDAIRASYESFGFEPLETPALEYADVLTGKYGDEGDKLMYRFRDNGDRDVAMRYDLTIPLARVAAQYESELRKPWRRYQISPVWRADNTQKGRYREFYQCDADIVGSSSPLADAEALALAASTLKRLGVEEFVVKVNSREVISAFYGKLGLSPELQVSAMRSVDKMDKVGAEGVREELGKKGFQPSVVDSICAFASTRIGDVEDISSAAQAFPEVAPALQRLSGIVQKAVSMAPGAEFSIDFSVTRGLDYYDGMVFEATLKAVPGFGTVCAGGRYDGLVGMFASKPIPAVGMSIGLDRLMAALEELKLVKGRKATADILVANLGDEYADGYLAIAKSLRAAGHNVAVYLDHADLKKQFSYANDKGMRYVVLYGENEAKSGKASVKDLERGSQASVSIKEIALFFKGDSKGGKRGLLSRLFS